ncbi:MAG: N-acetyltransferase family protein [Nitrososphaerales archaeon]
MARPLSDGVIVRDSIEEDLPEILEMYNDAVLNLTATFDLVPQSLEERRTWFLRHGGKYPVISADINGRVVGFCSISPFSSRAGYAPTVELSVYIHKEFRRKGIAMILMKEIISRAKELGYHAILSLIAANNEPSIALHDKLGFEHVAHLPQVGYKFSQWQDVDYYELLL